MSPPKTKKKANIRTLSDLENNNRNGIDGDGTHPSAYHKPIVKRPFPSNASGGKSTTTSSSSSMKFDDFRVCHIPNLPNANEALAIIQRVVKEFEPIMKRRGYSIRSVSEMCCCGDGLDYNTNGERSKRRKKRIMPNNVLGYNQTTVTSYKGGRNNNRKNMSHTIHIRLRHTASHDRLFLYEDVAGTMAHELAHCEISPHNDAFNKLMDDILEEHMVLQCQNAGGKFGGGGSSSCFGGGGNSITTSSGGGPSAFSGKGHVLGGGGGGGASLGTTGRGYKLGGDNVFSKFLSPKEAAVMAAEARRRQQKLRLRGSRCCQPCTITIPDNDDEEPIVEYGGPGGKTNDNDDDGNKKKPASKRSSQNVLASGVDKGEQKKKSKMTNTASSGLGGAVIDLTQEEIPNAARASAKLPSVTTSSSEEWNCSRCTFQNRPIALACDMCGTEKGTP